MAFALLFDLRERKARVFLPRQDYVTDKEPQFVKDRFRLDTACMDELVRQYMTSEWAVKVKRSHAISEKIQMQVALRFYATGQLYRDAADISHISRPSISRITGKVSQFLASLNEQHITFPTTYEEVAQTKAELYKPRHFPGIVGLIDGTHIAIKRPTGADIPFVNRKSFHSLNVQIVCDANMVITDIDASKCGRSHDSYVLNDSLVGKVLSTGAYGKAWLLGDSGYGCKTWLMTPFLAPTPAQESYNSRHKGTRVRVECCIGILKARFRCLNYKECGRLPFTPEKSSAVIGACAVLHNICRRKGITIRSELVRKAMRQEEEIRQGNIEQAADGAKQRDKIAASFMLPR